MGGTNQCGINTCHHNNKLDQILNHLHLIRNSPKSPINEYSDTSNGVMLSMVTVQLGHTSCTLCQKLGSHVKGHTTLCLVRS